MRRLTVILAAIAAVSALGAVAATSASAALPEFLPGSGTYSGTNGAGTLETKSKGNIECASSETKGELTSTKEGVVTIDFGKCKAFGFAAHSLGDPAETILFHGTTTLCYITKSPLDVGIVVHLPSGGLHLEIPTLGVLLLVTGSVIGLITPTNTSTTEYEINFEQSKGVQKFTKCEGGATESLSTSENEGTAEGSGEQATKQKVKFAAAHELMA